MQAINHQIIERKLVSLLAGCGSHELVKIDVATAVGIGSGKQLINRVITHVGVDLHHDLPDVVFVDAVAVLIEEPEGLVEGLLLQELPLVHRGRQELRVVYLTIHIKIEFGEHLVNYLDNELLVIVRDVVVQLNCVFQLFFVNLS